MTIGVSPDIIENEIPIPFKDIEEITGFNDKNVIEKVWYSATKSLKDREEIMNAVISHLLDNAPTANQKSAEKAKPKHNHNRSNSMETQTGEDSPTKEIIPKTVVDLTNDDDEVQKAIAASLQESNTPQGSMLGGQITREDQELSRVLEASLADANPNRGSGADRWFPDDVNPYNRARSASWPVGLKNIGNTCWFNAVVQSLFYIEDFRNLIVNYVPSEEFAKENPICVFMMELRYLFALLMASDRKYLNPASAIEILRHAFQANRSDPASNGQQDVSEFQHKLLDWLEEAFQHKSAEKASDLLTEEGDKHNEQQQQQQEVSSSQEPMDIDQAHREKDSNNEMVKLFYGKVKTYGTNAGQGFTNSTDFGQWPLCVAGYTDIYQSLEAGLAQEDIETNSDQTSYQERWFTKLPPVLTFELSRFSYSTTLTQAVKLHNKFAFPQDLYLDRYLDVNKEEIREKREKVKRLQSELSDLQHKLAGYTKYGTSDKKYPLLDVLENTLQYAQSGQSTQHQEQCPELMQAPVNSSPHDVPNRCTCSIRNSLPRPRAVSALELEILTSCITRWKTEISKDIEQYQRAIKSLKKDISQTYEEDHLRQNKYSLHAVMVHEGEAVSGHYWAYVYNNRCRCWLKYNDVSVTQCTWEEVVKESMGGNGTASAYCLIYIKSPIESNNGMEITSDGNKHLVQPADFLTREQALALLPADLQTYVEEDNQKLAEEKEQWDRSQTYIAQEAQDEPDVISNQTNAAVSMKNVVGIRSEVEDLAHDHALSILGLASKVYSEIKNKENANAVLTEIVDKCYDKYIIHREKLLENLPKFDFRVHICMYILVNYEKTATIDDVKAVMTDQVARLTLDTARYWPGVVAEAKCRSRSYWESHPEFQQKYITWHTECHQFRMVLALFVHAVKNYLAGRLEVALPLLHSAYVKNEGIINSAIQAKENPELRAMNMKLIHDFRNALLERINEMAITQFESEPDYKTPLTVMLQTVLPILDTMANGDGNDSDLVGSIKERWVNFLAEPDSLDESRSEALKDFLSQLFESARYPVSTDDNVQVPTDIGHEYKQALTSLSNNQILYL